MWHAEGWALNGDEKTYNSVGCMPDQSGTGWDLRVHGIPREQDQGQERGQGGMVELKYFPINKRLISIRITKNSVPVGLRMAGLT